MNIGHVDKLKECDICGEKVFARGLGGHKRLKHGIVVRIITKANSSTQVSNVGTRVSNSGTQVSNIGTQVSNSNSSTQVKRPVDYVKVSEKIVKKVNVPIFNEDWEDKPFFQIPSMEKATADYYYKLYPQAKGYRALLCFFTETGRERYIKKLDATSMRPKGCDVPVRFEEDSIYYVLYR